MKGNYTVTFRTTIKKARFYFFAAMISSTIYFLLIFLYILTEIFWGSSWAIPLVAIFVEHRTLVNIILLACVLTIAFGGALYFHFDLLYEAEKKKTEKEGH
jgi:hypothetical protein